MIMRVLTPADFGILSLITSFITIGTAVVGFGLRQVLSLEYFHCSAENRKHLINTIIITYSFVALFFLCVGIYTKNIIIQFFFVNQLSTYTYLLIISMIFVQFFVELFYQILQYEQQSLSLTMLHFHNAISTSVLTWLFIWFFQEGFAGIIHAQACVLTIIGSITIHSYIKNNYHFFLKFPYLTDCAHLIKAGLPFIPTVLFGWILATGDRWILAQYATLHDVGIYATADLISQLFYFAVLYPWSGSYLPYIMNQFNQHKDSILLIEQWNQKIMWQTMITVGIIIIVGFILTKPLLSFILPPAYYAATHYMLILLVGQLFLLGSYFAACFIQFHKKSYFLASAIAVPAFLNIGLNILLIPHFQIYGCTVATLISYVIYFMITLWYNIFLQRQYKKGL
jgi:O-antigen/teichoic acid export membrane protein